ncbi:hypothetical protein ON010_g3820 [Phytophthora cinnamomi]|nr:hypothetical protein ON010_g3820 [Phytophthora cinnamomi]
MPTVPARYADLARACRAALLALGSALPATALALVHDLLRGRGRVVEVVGVQRRRRRVAGGRRVLHPGSAACNNIAISAVSCINGDRLAVTHVQVQVKVAVGYPGAMPDKSTGTADYRRADTRILKGQIKLLQDGGSGDVGGARVPRRALRGDAGGQAAAAGRAGGGGGRTRSLDGPIPGRGRGATYAPDGQLQALPRVRADAAHGAAPTQRRRVRGPADGGGPGPLPTAEAAARDGRREFDRVHYPLPLTPELSPSPEVLQRTIRRLKQALAEKEKSSAATGGAGGDSQLAEENATLREENRCLKNTLKQYCDGTREGGNGVLNSTGELQRELQKDSNAAVQETLAQMVQMKSQLEETQLKNRELLRQLAIARAQAGQQGQRQRPALSGSRGSDLSSRFSRGRSPAVRQQRSPAATMARQQQNSNAVFPTPFQSSSSHYGPSDDEDGGGERTPRSARRGRPSPRPAFRRFDPTAYQQEKERKLREARARSNSRTRPPRSNGGYSSDSSVGGYSSAGSRGSRGSQASSRSTRSRSSRLSRERQRELDARLASPKRAMEPPPLETRRPRASNNSPLPRSGPPSARSRSRGRSPLPSPSQNSGIGRQTTPTGSTASSPRKSSPSVQQTPPQKKLNPQNPVLRRRKQPPQALLDTSADSFSDIDDRLTALQQFLREAKQGGIGTAGASTAA